MKRSFLPLSLLLVPLASAVHADITVSAGLTFAEQGGNITVGNLGTLGTAFAKDVILGGTLAPTHTIANVNNGLFGNANSWIGDSANSYVGIGFGTAQTIASFAFGRDNTGSFSDRAAGLYTIEYTNDPNPVANHATAAWTSIGTVNITTGGGVLAALRHRFNIGTPVTATGIRLFTPGDGIGSGAAVDELELYATPGAIIPLPVGIVTAGNPGYSITWNGNDGVNSGGAVPNNLALAANGGSAISSGSGLGPQLGIGFHIPANLNDGIYGNSNSWIGGDADTAPFNAGIMLNGLYDVTSIAWGRDNLAQFSDRSTGVYTVQRTIDGSTWETLGTVSLNFSDDTVPGGGATTPLRHEFGLSDGNGGVLARGIRLLVPGTGLAGGTAIDEIEIYGTAIPEPSAAVMLLAAAGLGLRRRR